MYVEYVNKNIHGLYIVQRLFDSQNRAINKYVNLSDKQINEELTNYYFSGNIFDDKAFISAKSTPVEDFEAISQHQNKFPNEIHRKLYPYAKEINKITSRLDKMRWEVSNLIDSLDLNKRENMSLVYDKMEEAVSMIEEFYDNYNAIFKTVNSLRVNQLSPENSLISTMETLYFNTINASRDIRQKNDSSFENYKKTIKSNIKILKEYAAQEYKGDIKTLLESIIINFEGFLKVLNDFTNGESLPEDYKLLDRYYYYYNWEFLSEIDTYNPGYFPYFNYIVQELNKDAIIYLEIPNNFKVVYPKVLQKTTYLESSDPLVENIPTSMKGRNVVIADRVIKVDTNIVTFQMYDHKLIDGDIVSISFNGDWIIEKFKISEKPYSFTIHLNDNGKNFLLLHADDMGRNPPATIALSYYLGGKKEIIILNSDTNKSELIQILKNK